MLAGQLEQEQVSVVARLLTPALPAHGACRRRDRFYANVAVVMRAYLSGGLQLVGRTQSIRSISKRRVVRASFPHTHAH